MTKNQDLQKELLAKVKPGTKPSHLKRSKSADDIPKTPPEIEELKKATDLNTLLQEQLKEKQKQIEELRQQREDDTKQIEELIKNLEEEEVIIPITPQEELSQL